MCQAHCLNPELSENHLFSVTMRRSFSHGDVAPRPCIATGKGVGKKIEKVGFTPCGSILSFLGFVTASLCNILLEQ